MQQNFSNIGPGDLPGKTEVNDEPLTPHENDIPIPGDPQKVGGGTENNEIAGDDNETLGDSFEKPHTTNTPSS